MGPVARPLQLACRTDAPGTDGVGWTHEPESFELLSLRTVRVCVAAFLLAAGARCTPKEVPFESPEPVPIRVLRVTNAYLPEFTDR